MSRASAGIRGVNDPVIRRHAQIVIPARTGGDCSRFRFAFAKQPQSRERLCLYGDKSASVIPQAQLTIIAQIVGDAALRAITKELPNLHVGSSVGSGWKDHAATVGQQGDMAQLVKPLR